MSVENSTKTYFIRDLTLVFLEVKHIPESKCVGMSLQELPIKHVLSEIFHTHNIYMYRFNLEQAKRSLLIGQLFV